MRKIQCKRCFFFTPEWCPKKRDSLDPDLIHDCQYFRIKTNADRIRSMSDEELSYLIIDNVDCNSRCKAWKNGCEYSDSTCRQAWLDWLKQECAE